MSLICEICLVLVRERQVTAVDADSGINAEITYSVDPTGTNSTDDVNSRFRVDDSSGQVRLGAALTPADVNATYLVNGTVNASYLVTVRATDAGTQSLSTVCNVPTTTDCILF